MTIFLFIYILGITFFYLRLRRLAVIYYILSILIILLISEGLAYFYPDVLSVQVINDINSLFITLDLVVLFIGSIYRFIYLKMKINNQAQLDLLFSIPAFTLFPRVLLSPSAKAIHDDVWQQYKNLK